MRRRSARVSRIGVADERQTLLELLVEEYDLVTARPGQILIGDKNYFGADFERDLAEVGLDPAALGPRCSRD